MTNSRAVGTQPICRTTRLCDRRSEKHSRSGIRVCASIEPVPARFGRLRCNASLLSVQEQRQVRMAVSQLNFQACFRGEAACREEALTDEQRIEVQQADRIRNFEACLGGLTRCNEAMWSEVQLAAVRDAYA